MEYLDNKANDQKFIRVLTYCKGINNSTPNVKNDQWRRRKKIGGIQEHAPQKNVT